MKTKEELNAIKEEINAVSAKLHELTEDELAEVTGGLVGPKVLVGVALSGGLPGMPTGAALPDTDNPAVFPIVCSDDDLVGEKSIVSNLPAQHAEAAGLH